MQVKIETSARHIHLTAEDYKILFGDKEPTVMKELGQGEKACEETIEIVGPKANIGNVRLLIPFRDNSQLEVSKTDCFSLGLDAPLKISGDLPGALIKINGPVGNIEKEIAIVAKRHLHASPTEASELGLSNNDSVDIKVSGDRGLVLSNTIVRIKDIFSLTVHVDTDEANAAGISSDANGELLIN